MQMKLSLKVTVSALSIASTLIFSALPAFAQTATGSANQSARLSALHTACDNAVSQRLASLQTLQTRITDLKKLSADQKTQYAGEITTDVNGLTSLKAKCDGDTDLTTLRADYHSVFTSYRIYAVFIPQLHLLVASDTMGYTADLLSNYATKLQSRIQQDGNPSNLTALLSDMQAKITDAHTQYSQVESQVGSLTPDSYNTNPTGIKTTLQNARNEIKIGAQDLKTAWQDAQQIRQGLKPETNATVSPVPTISH